MNTQESIETHGRKETGHELQEQHHFIGGFRPGPFMDVGGPASSEGAQANNANARAEVRSFTSFHNYLNISNPNLLIFRTIQTNTNGHDPPHLIMTYTALLALAILRDDFTNLDRIGLINLIRASQKPDGRYDLSTALTSLIDTFCPLSRYRSIAYVSKCNSFTSTPGQGEADLRTVYTAFVISSMLDDWSGIDVPKALEYISRCATYEGGYGQQPGNEAQGATRSAMLILELPNALLYS